MKETQFNQARQGVNVGNCERIPVSTDAVLLFMPLDETAATNICRVRDKF